MISYWVVILGLIVSMIISMLCVFLGKNLLNYSMYIFVMSILMLIVALVKTRLGIR